MDRSFFLKNLWLWKCNKVEMNMRQGKNINSWSWEFQELMKNRCKLGAYRYGQLKHPDKKQYDRIGDIKKRLSKYEKTGNKEHLVDAANLCMLEFEEGDGFFESTDDKEHVRIKYGN